MARPRKAASDKREYTIRVRVTLDEKNQIWQEAADARLSPSDFMRLKSIGSAPKRHMPSPDRTILLNYLAELGKIGSNINQIARALNRRAESVELVGIYPDDITRAINGLDLLTAHLTKMLTDGDYR